MFINTRSPLEKQKVTSPNHIHTLYNKKVMRILKLIRLKLLSQSNNTFSELIHKEMCSSWKGELTLGLGS